jgi:hypothetical protein
VEAGDGAQQGRFAGAIGSEDADDLSRRHSQRDALQRGYGALIDDLELVDGEQGAVICALRPRTYA